MKTLLVMRHAKSSWKYDGLEDHERPLNGRGKRDAPRMGRLLRAQRLVPERVLCSSAVRAQKTARLVSEACGLTTEPTVVDDLYGSGASAYLRAARGVGDGIDRIMIVGHNPDCERVIARLTEVDTRMPTAAIACIDLDVDDWREVNGGGAGVGRLISVWRPKEIGDAP